MEREREREREDVCRPRAQLERASEVLIRVILRVNGGIVRDHPMGANGWGERERERILAMGYMAKQIPNLHPDRMQINELHSTYDRITRKHIS